MTRRGFLALTASIRDDSMARLAGRGLQEFLLLRRDTASIIEGRWDDLERAAPLGSLVKPFVALAYGESQAFRYPELQCSLCWLPGGHGRLGITAALAQSCNTYFARLAALTPIENIESTAARYGLPMPSDTSPEALIGHFGAWRATPVVTARAYGELALRHAETGAAVVLDALSRCATAGTASGIGAGVAAKTGTAPCTHARRSTGDGLVAVILPDYVLLARAHGVPGAECARRAGPFVRAVLK